MGAFLSRMNLTTTVQVQTILTTLIDNRRRHVEFYEEAVEGYIQKAKAHLASLQAKLEAGEAVPIRHGGNTLPSNHVREYDTIIAMLQAHEGTTIRLSIGDYRKMIEDDWDWMDSWKDSNRVYSPSLNTHCLDLP